MQDVKVSSESVELEKGATFVKSIKAPEAAWHEKQFDDEGTTVSKAFVQELGFARALILDHIFFTFVYHYDSPNVVRRAHPDRPGEEPRTWIFFTLTNFVRHIGLVESNIRSHLKALREEGWIESFYEAGKQTFFRPNLERFFNSSHYRAKVKKCDREPDFPGGNPRSEHDKMAAPEPGTRPPSNQAPDPHRIRHRGHILENDLKEPFKEEPRAHANAREGEVKKEADFYKPKYSSMPLSQAEQSNGTPFDNDTSATDEESRARHKRVLLAALLEGSSATLIRRKAAEWGFEIDSLVKEASELRAKKATGARNEGPAMEVLRTMIKTAGGQNNSVA